MNVSAQKNFPPLQDQWVGWVLGGRQKDIPWRRWTWSSRWRSWRTSWSSSPAEKSCPVAGPKAVSCSSCSWARPWTLGWWKPGLRSVFLLQRSFSEVAWQEKVLIFLYSGTHFVDWNVKIFTSDKFRFRIQYKN